MSVAAAADRALARERLAASSSYARFGVEDDAGDGDEDDDEESGVRLYGKQRALGKIKNCMLCDRAR